MITLRQLDVFDQVARAGGHVTQAAAALNVSQPSVSDTVRALEGAVGAKLLEGRGRSRGLTPAGEIYLDYARQILLLVDKGRQAVADLDEEVNGHLQLVAVPTAGEHLVPIALNSYLERFPSVDVSLAVANRANAIDPLSSGRADLAIMGRPPAGVDAEARPFLPNSLLMLCAPDHPLASGKPGLSEVAETTLLIRERGSGTRAAVEQAFASADVELRRTMELGSNAAVVAALHQRLGVAVLPEVAVADDVAAGRLTSVSAPKFPLARQWHVMWRTGYRLSAPARAFIDVLAAMTVHEDGNVSVTHPALQPG